MKILIISPGKNHDHTVESGIQEYEKRLSKRVSLEWIFPKPDTKESEGTAITKLVREEDLVILLDERGKEISTTGLSELFDKEMQEGRKRIVFIIGGAFGVDKKVASCAHKTYKLSSLVFPHMLVRLILTEQIYRALSIIEGGKYHHA